MAKLTINLPHKGASKTIFVDNGSDFVSNEMDQWAHEIVSDLPGPKFGAQINLPAPYQYYTYPVCKTL